MRPAALALALVGLILAAAPARAWEPDAEATRRLGRGQAVIEVRPDPAGTSGLVRAAIEIDAPPRTVWAVMLDCDLAPRLVSNLKSCRILARDPAGRWDVREEVSKPFLAPPLRTEFRADYDPPRGYSFHRTGGDLPVLEGQWRLTPLDGGRRTRVVYESRAALPFAAPGPVARMMLRHEIAEALQALKRESRSKGAGDGAERAG